MNKNIYISKPRKKRMFTDSWAERHDAVIGILSIIIIILSLLVFSAAYWR